MKRFVIALLALIALLAGCASPPKEVKLSTFTNPVYAGTKDKLPEAPDPTAIKFNGEYYAYVTGDPCLVLKSDDMVHWKLVGPMMSESSNCWAPSVVYKNGTFYAYAATVLHGMAEGSRRVRLYTSQSPTGPFEQKATVTTHYSYDGQYFRDDDGQEYLYWTQECGLLPYKCSGNATVVDKLVSPDKLAGQMSFVAGPEGWECKSRCILEAPAVIKRDGRYFLQYSGAAYENDTYGGGYVVATKAADTTWTKMPQVLKSIEAKLSGPGGADWIKAPNNLDDWTIYHGRGMTPETWDRWLRVDPIMWGQDRFWIPGGPSIEAQVAPALPTFRDLFGGDKLSGDWKTAGGKWTVADGRLTQMEGGVLAKALVTKAAASDYVAEVNVRLLPGGQGRSAGMVLNYTDEKNYATAVIDRARKALVISENGLEKAAFTPSDFNPEVWHQILAVRNDRSTSFYVDGVLVGGVGLEGTGRMGVITDGTPAEFDGVAMTHGWEDLFESANVTWGDAEDGTKRSGTWQVTDSALVGQGDMARAFRGTRQWGNYEFEASFRPASPDAKPGLYAAWYDAKNYAVAVIDPQTRTLTTSAVVKGKEQPAESVNLPPDVDFTAYHTVRIVKNGFAFAIYFDGALVQQRSFTLAQGQPGLLVNGGRVQFDSIRAVRWD